MSEEKTGQKKCLDSKEALGATIGFNSTPHAYPSNGEAHQAGSFCFSPIKPSRSYEEQISLLEARGLVVSDREDAAKFLSEANYYRLSGYWLTLRGEKGFKSGVSLSDVEDIYALDSEVRFWLWSAIAPVELKLRTSLAYHIARSLGPLGHEDPVFFRDTKEHGKSMANLRRERDKAQRDGVPCVRHNMEKYGDLPVWAAVEIMGMGTISRLYGNLSSNAAYEDGKTVKSCVARDFGLKSPYLMSWLRYLTYVRNICGHHNRFYNRVMTSRPKIMKRDSGIPNTNKQFQVFIILMRLYESSWPDRWPGMLGELTKILDSHPAVDLKPMGFPENWRELLSLERTPQCREGGSCG